MTTIYVDSRKRVAGSDSDFEVDLGESLHLQSDARPAVYKIRIADSFLSTDRGRYLYWVDAALGTLNWALLPEGAYTGSRLAAWISSNFATATYSETTNSSSEARRARIHPRRIITETDLSASRIRIYHGPRRIIAETDLSASSQVSSPENKNISWSEMDHHRDGSFRLQPGERLS